MKTKLIQIVAFLTFAIAPLQAQSLLNTVEKSADQQAVERVDQRRTRLIMIIEMELRQTYQDMTQGDQQARLDLLGTKAKSALTEYAELRAWVLVRNPKANIPAPDPTVFVPQANGTVKYVAPPKPVIPTPVIPAP